MSDIVERLRFDAARSEAQFSKGVATNIEEAAAEIERLRGENYRLSELVLELERKLHNAAMSCVYEARPYPGQPPQSMFQTQNYTAGAWCQTHGWNCPNVRRA